MRRGEDRKKKRTMKGMKEMEERRGGWRRGE